MKLTNDELKLVTVLAVNGPAGAAVALPGLEVFFDRPVKLRSAVESLARWGLITRDPFKAEVRLLALPVLRALHVQPARQAVLFPDQQPLDEPLASASARAERPAAVGAVNAEHSCVPPPTLCVQEHAPCVPGHGYVTSTSNRENVSTIKRSRCETRALSAAQIGELREALRVAVGDQDFQEHWARAGFWHCDQRPAILAGTLRYVTTCIRDGVATRKSVGQRLWAQFKIDCRAQGLEALIR